MPDPHHQHSHQLSLGRRMFRSLLRRPSIRRIVQSIGGRMLKHMPGQITCRQFEGFVIDYIEGRLSDRQLKLFNRHMAVCPFCRTSLAAYVQAIEMGKAICAESEKGEPFQRAPQELIDAILEVTVGKD